MSGKIIKATGINYHILQQARNRAELSLDEVQKKYKDIAKWEAGEKIPTINQVEYLSYLYCIPYTYFFKDKVEFNDNIENLGMVDFRRGTNIRYSVAFIEFLKHTIKNINLLALITNDANEIPKIELNDALNVVTKKIDNFINFSIEDREVIKDSNTFLQLLIDKIRGKGIYVIRFSSSQYKSYYNRVSINDFRALSIYNENAPAIILNNQDAINAQIFSLVHELAHLLLRQNVISHIDLLNDDKTEMFCNNISASYLMPEDYFRNIFNQYNIDSLDNIERVFKVSKHAILYRAYKLNLIDKTTFQEEFNKLKLRKNSDKSVSSLKSGGGNYYKSKRSHLGTNLIYQVYNAIQNRSITYSQASSILNAKPVIIDKLVEGV